MTHSSDVPSQSRRGFLAAASISTLGLAAFERLATGAAAAEADSTQPDAAGNASKAVLIRHEGKAPRERSTCGWRDRLISREDADKGVAAWAHAVDIDGAKPHYHRVATELYYVLEGEGSIVLDGEEHPISKGSLVHIPPGVVHGAKGRMRILVVGIPDLCDDDLFCPDADSNCDP